MSTKQELLDRLKWAIQEVNDVTEQITSRRLAKDTAITIAEECALALTNNWQDPVFILGGKLYRILRQGYRDLTPEIVEFNPINLDTEGTTA